MTDSSQLEKAQDLQRAFDVFNQVSHELTQAYAGLQARVQSLTDELAVANGELRRQYEEKEALSERLGLLLDALPAGVVVVDAAGAVSEANPAARAMLGEDLCGRAWQGVAGALQPVAPPDEFAIGGRRVSLAESALASAGGRIILIHDISAAHEMKANLERSQRLAAMGEMAASLAHQLRTPLATALLYSANLAKPDLADDARARFAEKASEQLRRLERLIQDVLLFARGEQIGREVIPLGELLAEAAQTMEPQCALRGVTLRRDGEAGAAIIVGGRKPLAGALLNLLENALQVCEPGGTVGLGVEVLGKRVRIRVRDTGPGIPPEQQERIFEPFFTTKAHGTGLGLAIAQGVARAHGGGIAVSSRAGDGAEFVIDLPVGTVADIQEQG
ncbi:sensor histidine kinase [Azospira restricta]|uniref:histidine kinase n=1 Tax=Azospira restricta TaxID=404405 RepID=A0A974SS96_9RHOO|nr:HAMP domain-containing sensor histidine kinase [Azospira restricta]QRJ65474.1 HAMP domain-containing histidine kinase [Azospira restricta]